MAFVCPGYDAKNFFILKRATLHTLILEILLELIINVTPDLVGKFLNQEN